MKNLSALVCLFWMLSLGPVISAGVVMTKRTPDESPEYWHPIEFTDIENYPTSVVITTKVTKQSQSIPRYQIGKVIEFADFNSISLISEEQANKLKAVRDAANELAKQFKNASGILAAVVQSYDQALGRFADGNVLVGGKWVNRHEYEAKVKADEVAVRDGSVSEIVVGKKTFRNVKVTRVVDARISFMHEAGVGSVGQNDLDPASLARLKKAFPSQFAIEVKEASPSSLPSIGGVPVDRTQAMPPLSGTSPLTTDLANDLFGIQVADLKSLFPELDGPVIDPDGKEVYRITENGRHPVNVLMEKGMISSIMIDRPRHLDEHFLKTLRMLVGKGQGWTKHTSRLKVVTEMGGCAWVRDDEKLEMHILSNNDQEGAGIVIRRLPEDWIY